MLKFCIPRKVNEQQRSMSDPDAEDGHMDDKGAYFPLSKVSSGRLLTIFLTEMQGSVVCKPKSQPKPKKGGKSPSTRILPVVERIDDDIDNYVGGKLVTRKRCAIDDLGLFVVNALSALDESKLDWSIVAEAVYKACFFAIEGYTYNKTTKKDH